jgi:5-carboxymethyl-2-hydroxymuconate isomerase
VPHLTLEYSANLAEPADLKGVLVELNRLIADVGGIQIENLKSRAVRRDVYAVGAGGGEGGFVHLEIAIFGGRSAMTREKIGRGSLAVLERHFTAVKGGSALQITIEVRDMDREGYFKRA